MNRANQELTEKLRKMTEERDQLLSAYQDALGLSVEARKKPAKDVHTEHVARLAAVSTEKRIVRL